MVDLPTLSLSEHKWAEATSLANACFKQIDDVVIVPVLVYLKQCFLRLLSNLFLACCYCSSNMLITEIRCAHSCMLRRSQTSVGLLLGDYARSTNAVERVH